MATRKSAVCWSDTAAIFENGSTRQSLKTFVDPRWPAAMVNRGVGAVSKIVTLRLSSSILDFDDEVRQLPDTLRAAISLAKQGVEEELSRRLVPIGRGGEVEISLVGYSKRLDRFTTTAVTGDIDKPDVQQFDDWGFFLGPTIGEPVDPRNQGQKTVERLARRQAEAAKNTFCPAGGDLIICRLSENGASIIRVNDFFN
ncbi:MAG: hypothetical protein NFW16_21035 [Candidatus Accumulibacter sp.]|uniref:hypothetical protein n=1 Tax=Accumulibacter sp. TaxID=2053492 RepID=UPI002586226A|nr:hypothetical protein [Accumulibacter sp.]MCM8624151.1 hypothetical protein [Accumulibacter sp.]